MYQAAAYVVEVMCSILLSIIQAVISVMIDLEWMLMVKSIGSMVTVLWGHFSLGVATMYQVAAYVVGTTASVLIQLLNLLLSVVAAIVGVLLFIFKLVISLVLLLFLGAVLYLHAVASQKTEGVDKWCWW